MIWLGQAEATDEVTFSQGGQELVFLGVTAVSVDWPHDQGGLNAKRRSVSAVHSCDTVKDTDCNFELLKDTAVNVV